MTPDVMAAIGDPAWDTYRFPLVEHPLPGLRQGPPADSSLTYINRIGIRKGLSTPADDGNGRLHVVCCDAATAIRGRHRSPLQPQPTRSPSSRCKPTRRKSP
jgi:hypothetical protein